MKVLFVDLAVGGKLQAIRNLCAYIYVLELEPRDASTLGKESAAHPHLSWTLALLSHTGSHEVATVDLEQRLLVAQAAFELVTLSPQIPK